MPVAELREGQRVVLDNYGVYEEDRWINERRYTGIVRISTFPHLSSPDDLRFFLESDVPNEVFHWCEGQTERGRGWFIKPHEVSLLEPEGPYKCRRPKSGYGQFVNRIERIENASI